jgi:hypothetical protein
VNTSASAPTAPEGKDSGGGIWRLSTAYADPGNGLSPAVHSHLVTFLSLGRTHPQESFNESSRPFKRLRFSLSLLHRYLAALISAMTLIVGL